MAIAASTRSAVLLLRNPLPPFDAPQLIQAVVYHTLGPKASEVRGWRSPDAQARGVIRTGFETRLSPWSGSDHELAQEPVLLLQEAGQAALGFRGDPFDPAKVLR